MTAPDPSRLAALDQRLADLDSRLDRTSRAVMRGDVVCGCVAVAVIIVVLTVRPHLYDWEYVIALAAVAFACASGVIQGLILRSCRAEIRDLRSRAPR